MNLDCGLSAVIERVTAAIPGADCGAVVVPGPARTIGARAVQGDLSSLVVDLQNEIGQGPWLDAVTTGSWIRIRDTRAEGRWPLFRGPAAALGALSMLCTPVVIGGSAAGSLCMISKTAGTFDGQAGDLAAVFAEHAAIALAGAELTRLMRESLNTQVLFAQAKGIIMERHQVTSDAAFAMLSRAARYSRTTLRGAAAEVCLTGHLPGNSNPPIPRPGCPPVPHPPGYHPSATPSLIAGHIASVA